MKIDTLTYSQFDNQAREWKFDTCSFEMINLIVGKNATGKTRTMNILRGLAALISESDTLQWAEGSYKVEFSIGNELYSYALQYHDRKVLFEELNINGVPKLSRTQGGVCRLYAEKVGDYIDFQTDSDRIAVSAKRDSVQHPYLDNLYEWAKGVTRYDFGSDLGKNLLMIRLDRKDKLDTETKINIKDTEKAGLVLLQGERQFGSGYKKTILDDMKFLEYDIQDVGVTYAEGLEFHSSTQLPNIPSVLFVQESDLPATTQQQEMSSGMFKALSVLIQVNYALLSGEATCLLIDDIGEGLDFVRSSALVKKLVEKVKDSNIQLIMATNDRFIMNAVSLENWIVLIRKGGHVRNLNYRNSTEIFDKFQDIGLNNFDFFSGEYYQSNQQ